MGHTTGFSMLRSIRCRQCKKSIYLWFITFKDPIRLVLSNICRQTKDYVTGSKGDELEIKFKVITINKY